MESTKQHLLSDYERDDSLSLDGIEDDGDRLPTSSPYLSRFQKLEVVSKNAAHQAWQTLTTSSSQVLNYTFLLSCLLSILPRYIRPGGLRTTKPLRSTAWLDALRGFAAIVVLNNHLPTWSVTDHVPVLSIMQNGTIMVNIFFIISGFALTRKLSQLLRQQREAEFLRCLASSMFRRYMRLYGSAVVGTFISMVILHLVKWPSHLKPTFPAQVADWFWDTLQFTNPFGFIPGFLNSKGVSSEYNGFL